MGLKSDGLVQVVRADVLVHLLGSQWLTILQQGGGTHSA